MADATEHASETATPEHLQALDKFAAKHGRNWRETLRGMWYNGTDANEEDGHLLRQIRNRIEFAKEGGFIATYKPKPLPVKS